jgi:hypothetical protein
VMTKLISPMTWFSIIFTVCLHVVMRNSKQSAHHSLAFSSCQCMRIGLFSILMTYGYIRCFCFQVRC